MPLHLAPAESGRHPVQTLYIALKLEALWQIKIIVSRPPGRSNRLNSARALIISSSDSSSSKNSTPARFKTRRGERHVPRIGSLAQSEESRYIPAQQIAFARPYLGDKSSPASGDPGSCERSGRTSRLIRWRLRAPACRFLRPMPPAHAGEHHGRASSIAGTRRHQIVNAPCLP